MVQDKDTNDIKDTLSGQSFELKKSVISDGYNVVGKIDNPDPNESDICYKYMSLDSAFLCLRNGKIRFAEPKTWQDKSESRLYSLNFKHIDNNAVCPSFYALCATHKGHNEAAWKVYTYGKVGLGAKCVEFKIDQKKFIKQILDQIKKLNKKMEKNYQLYVGKETYVKDEDFYKILGELERPQQSNSQNCGSNYIKILAPESKIGFDNYLNFMLLKRGTFEHEQELRFVIVDTNDIKEWKENGPNLDVTIKWQNVVKEVYYSCDFTEVEKSILKESLEKAGVKLVGKNKVSVCEFNPYESSVPQADNFFQI